MKITLEKAGKKYYKQWVFRNLDLAINYGDRLAILGPNGSGKSTLLQVISGALLLTEGKIKYMNDTTTIPEDEVFSSVAIAAPYLELVEEFTLEESVKLHFSFKKQVNGISAQKIIELSELNHARHKQVKFFSSGMKQRLKLTLACLSDVPVLLLDEPCSNLDKEGTQWYNKLIEDFGAGKTIVVCSNNHQDEFSFCKTKINIGDYSIGSRF